jgi:2'-5' RNA ligase
MRPAIALGQSRGRSKVVKNAAMNASVEVDSLPSVGEERSFWDLTWERLLARDRMRPDMRRWRREWGPDRRYLVFGFEAAGVAELVDAAGRIRPALEALEVTPVPSEGLHLTIRPVSFVDALADAPEVVAAQAAEALHAAGVAPVEVVGAGSFDDAAILQIAPWGGLREIQRRLLDGVPALAPGRSLAERPAAEGGFAPHVSVAYYEEPIPAAEIARALKPFRRMTGPRFVVDTVALVSIPPPVHAFTWDVVARFRLDRA